MPGKNDKLKTGTLINWEGVMSDVESVPYLGLSKNFKNPRHKEQSRHNFNNLELGIFSRKNNNVLPLP